MYFEGEFVGIIVIERRLGVWFYRERERKRKIYTAIKTTNAIIVVALHSKEHGTEVSMGGEE